MSKAFLTEFADPTIVKHAFFNRNIEHSSHRYVIKDNVAKSEAMLNRKHAMEIFGYKAESLCLLKQIHSNKIVIVDKAWEIEQEPAADALVTKQKGLVLGVYTADCVPILVADDKNQVIAAIHAGWRSARSDIILQTIKAMQTIGAVDITAIIGPCIQQDSYEIGPEFYDNFLEEDPANQQYFIPSDKANHFLFDLPGYVKNKLALAGLAKIFDLEHDTLKEPKNYFSFRRSTLKKDNDFGNNLSVIVLK